jgi:FkbM family methyltransferase
MASVLIAVPTYKNQLTATTFLTTHALTNLLRSKGMNAGVTAISSPDIEWVRNFFLSYWYDKQPQYSHLLMIDDDMGFMPDVVVDMLLFDEPVVGALYPKKVYPVQWAVSGLADPETRGPFLEVEGLGCGCFLIRRDAITTMIEKMPELVDSRVNAVGHEFMQKEGVTRLIRAFNCIEDPVKGRVSEDISFGRRWRECGGKVWAATHHKMVHVGPHEYANTYAEWAANERAMEAESRKREIEAAPILKENPVLRGKPCKHGLMIYNPNDTFIGASLEAYGEWCEFEIDLLRRFIQPGDTVIDVGANIGTHTLAFARMVGKEGRVFAFEAQPRLEKILEANIRLNRLQNVVWDCKAIGHSVAQIRMQDLPDDDVKANFGAVPLFENGRYGYIDGEMITIDSFACDGDAFGVSPSVIKIDVEGMEADVIRGAAGTIERCKPILYMENNGDHSEKIAAAMEEIGYRAYWSIGPYFNPSNAFKNTRNIWPTLGWPSANLIAIPKESSAKFAEFEPFIGPQDNWRKAVERLAAAYQKQAAE